MESRTGSSESSLCITVNYRASTIRVFKAVFQVFDNPRYLQFWINPDVKALYIRGTNIREKDCLEIPPESERRKSYYVFYGKRFIKRISALGGWSLEKPHMIIGRYLEDMKILVFDLLEEANREERTEADG